MRLDEPLIGRLAERSRDISIAAGFVERSPEGRLEDVFRSITLPMLSPVIFFTLQLIVFFEGLRSERQLLRVVADRLSLR